MKLARPFRAWVSSFGLDSQGGALGYRRTPRWGWGHGAVRRRRLCSRELSLGTGSADSPSWSRALRR